MYTPRKLSQCHNIYDLRALARQKLPGPIFHYLDGGAEDEFTARRNTSSFDRDRIIPRCLVDVTSVRTATRVLGQDLEWPVFCSPAGAARFLHPDGELAAARAIASAGTMYGLSTMATYSLEEVAAASKGPKMFQLYIFKDRGVTRELIERCKRAGFGALCLTVDTAVPGKRERDLRTGWGIPIKLSLDSAVSFALRPGWCFGLVRKGPLSVSNVEAQIGKAGISAQTRFVGEQLDPSVSWKDVRQFIEQWDGPFAIKGILAPDDAKRAADVGASAVIVSNHGGRQLDGAASSFEALPGVVDAVGARLEVILDGGVRRGAHVFKALARGARACTIGRPYLFGLAAGGEAGVKRALDILRSEFVRAMQLAGCTDVTGLGAEWVQRF